MPRSAWFEMLAVLFIAGGWVQPNTVWSPRMETSESGRLATVANVSVPAHAFQQPADEPKYEVRPTFAGEVTAEDEQDGEKTELTITDNGILLRGPVKSLAEKAMIEALARDMAGGGIVDNQLYVRP